MTKLEYMAMSLPYGLKIFNEELFGRQVLRLLGLNANDGIHNYGSSCIRFLKPICRPLSDLTKEIEHNGERFVPIVKLAIMFNLTMYQYIDNKFYCQNYGRFKNIEEMPFSIIQQLVDWHFAAGLPENEFIPVTDEFNPYK